jgi:hypothetical protein
MPRTSSSSAMEKLRPQKVNGPVILTNPVPNSFRLRLSRPFLSWA